MCHNPLDADAAYCPYCGTRQDNVREEDRFEYAAFISYRHLPRDTQVAKQVQRAIETYRLPRGIAHHGGADGSRRLGKVFRDEDELPATHSLPEHISRALARSRTLVVVCSPDTPASMWVQLEIATFAKLHGRDHIFAVLASGTSVESIPDLLKTRMMPDTEGVMHHMPAEPLAADFRPEAARRSRAERLRIIAAVAGCGYDDLRQRQRKRLVRNAGASAAALTLVAGGFALLAHDSAQSRHAATLAESYQLAIESEHLLEQGDRYGAIEAALDALPSSSEDSQPYAPEAQQALENALQVHPDESVRWLPSYIIETDEPVGSFTDKTMTEHDDETPDGKSDIEISPAEGYFAVGDKAGQIVTYDTQTGRKLANCSIPVPGSLPTGNNFGAVELYPATDDRMVVAKFGTSNGIAAFDARTGEMLWNEPDMAATTGRVDPEGTGFFMTMVVPNQGFISCAYLIETGVNVGDAVWLNETTIPSHNDIRSTIGPQAANYWLAADGKLMSYELTTDGSFLEDIPTCDLALPHCQDLEFGIETAIATSVDDDEVDYPYAIESFDRDLNRVWSIKGTSRGEMLINDDWHTIVYGFPEIWGFLPGDEDTDLVVASVGQRLLLIDAANGAVIYDEKQPSTIVNVQIIFDIPKENIAVFVATCDGTVTMKSPFSKEDYEGNSNRFILPEEIRWAGIGYRDDGEYQIVALSAKGDNRILSYHSNLTKQLGSDYEYTLDELIELGHETLAEAGRE